jgi:predicted amidohydrolase YtcJ
VCTTSDGGRGALELFAELRDAGELTLRVWQSVPAERLAAGDLVPQLADPLLRIGYVKAFMDGDARVTDRPAARRLGRGDHELRATGSADPPG